jgi:hypothetical protein
MDCVYVIGTNEGPYKVGITGDLNARIKTLQTACPHPLRAVVTAGTKTAKEHERILHSALSQYRLSGEWFRCKLEIIMTAMSDSGLDPEFHISDQDEDWMSPQSFLNWLSEMAKPPFYASEEECARRLGVISIVAMKKNGADLRTSLACRAILHRMKPYR